MLDIRTLILITGLIAALIAVVFTVMWRRPEGGAPAGHWAAGFGLAAVGSVGAALRGMVPDVVSIVGAALLVQIYILLVVRGLCCYTGHRFPARPAVAALAVFTLGHAYWGLVDPSMKARIVNFFTLFGLFNLAGAAHLWWRFPGRARGVGRLAAGVFLLMAVVYLGHAASTAILGTGGNALIDPDPLRTLAVVVSILGSVALAMTMLWMVAADWHARGLEAIQDRLEAERRFRGKVQQLQKAESLGRMAGAIAHHFNNQLSVVIGNLEMVLGDLPGDAENRENLFQAFEAGHKAADKSTQMLRYLGHISGNQTTINLSDVCHQSLALLQSALPGGVTLKVDFPDSGPFVHADAGQIQRVLTNLLTNAQESLLDNQGIIGLTIQTVSHEDISTSNRFPLDWHPQDNPYACLEISDTGHGISSEDIEKLFDPFYTTKFTGRGMGLPVIMGILKTHNGCTTVDNEPECGCVFRVYLPISTETIPVQHEKVTTPKGNVGNGGTVLLIEDEASVRNMAKAMLTRLGYAVIEAQDGVEAVRLFQEHQNEIDCVLSDLTMPRMNGWETLTALREKGTDVPVILASGYDENTVMAGDHPELPQGFLNKPYSMAALKDVLMEVLRLS